MRTGRTAGILINDFLTRKAPRKAETILELLTDKERGEALDTALALSVGKGALASCSKVLEWGGRITPEAGSKLKEKGSEMIPFIAELLKAGARKEDFKVNVYASAFDKNPKTVDLTEDSLREGDHETYEALVKLGFVEIDLNKEMDDTTLGMTFLYQNPFEGGSVRSWDFLLRKGWIPAERIDGVTFTNTIGSSSVMEAFILKGPSSEIRKKIDLIGKTGWFEKNAEVFTGTEMFKFFKLNPDSKSLKNIFEVLLNHGFDVQKQVARTGVSFGSPFANRLNACLAEAEARCFKSENSKVEPSPKARPRL